MRIGIAGPVATANIAAYLSGDPGSLPQGYRGAPFMGVLIGALLARGHEVSAYTTDARLPHNVERPVVAAGPRFRIYYCPQRPRAYRFHGGAPGRIMDFFRVERTHLTRAIDRDKPDVVHAHWTYEFALAALESGRPCVVTAHDSPSMVLRYIPTMYRLGRYLMARRVLRLAPVLTAVSPYLKEQLTKYTSARIEVVPNPLDERLLAMDGAGYDPDRPGVDVAMVINGWGTLKNPQPAFKAFGKLRKQLPEVRLHTFGYDFGPGGKAEEWCKRRGLAEGVEFVGPIGHAELIGRLSESQALLHPSLEEAHPMSIAEAMAVGVPVVAGRASGGIPWLLDDGAAGILTDVTSPEAMADAVADILTNSKLRRALSEAGRRRIQELCDPMAVATAYEAVYARALGSLGTQLSSGVALLAARRSTQ